MGNARRKSPRLNRVRAEFRSTAQPWEEELCELQDDYVAIVGELGELRRDRLERAVMQAFGERALNPDMLLH